MMPMVFHSCALALRTSLRRFARIHLLCWWAGRATGNRPTAPAASHAVLRSERETPLRASSSAEHLQRLEARVLELERSLPANHPQACPSREIRQ